MSSVRLFPVALLLLAAAATPSLFAAPPDAFGKVVRSVRFEADQPLDQARYRELAGLQPGETLTRTKLKEALQALYDSGRFSMLAVDSADVEGGVGIVFNLRLNYYFDKFLIQGKLNLGGRSLREAISLPVGERFTPQGLEEARQSVLDYLRGQGHFLAEVQARTRREEVRRQVEVTFDVQPGELALIRSVELLGVPPAEDRAVRGKLGFRPQQKYDRSRLRRRLESLKGYLVKRGYLAALPEISDTFRASDNTVSLLVRFSDFGKVRVVLEGFKIDKNRLRRLLPVLSGEGLDPDLLEEGVRNLKEHLEERGYPEAEIDVEQERDKSGTLVVRYKVDAGRKVTVTYVRFRGNEALSDDELLGAIQIQPSRFLQKSVYSVSKLDSDVESLTTLYQSRGYPEAAVYPLVEPIDGAEKLGITFECEEGPLSRTGTVRIDGNRSLATAALLARMELQPGSPYAPHKAEHDRQALLAAYNDAGFLQARVTYQIGTADADGAFPVEIDIQEGLRSLVDDVIVLGNEHTRPSVIEKRIALRASEPLSLGKMLETQRALYNTGVFDLVRVSPQNPNSTTPFQNVVVRLEEAKQLTLRYGLGWQEREHLRGTFELSHLNILGTAQRADLRLRGSQFEQLGILSFQQPMIRFLPVNSYLTLTAQSRREVSFDVKRLNLSYQFGRAINNHTWALLRYNFRNVRVSNVQAVASREDTPRNLSTLSAIYINDTRDNYLDPERGFFTSTDLSLTTKLLGSNNYLSLYTQNSYHRMLSAPVLVAGSLRFGFAHPFGGDTDLPISERFFAGGGSSLRGFDTDYAGPLDPVTHAPTGGQALFIGNVELRLPLLSAVHLAGFYDSGNVFGSLKTVRLQAFSHSVGLGLRIKTPFGPLRVDYGINLSLPDELRRQGHSSRHLFVTIGPPF